jgi:hypothetical protein
MRRNRCLGDVSYLVADAFAYAQGDRRAYWEFHPVQTPHHDLLCAGGRHPDRYQLPILAEVPE